MRELPPVPAGFRLAGFILLGFIVAALGPRASVLASAPKVILIEEYTAVW